MSDRPRAILVGGVYGSGKSTLARSLDGLATVVDYDEVIGDIQGDGVYKDEALMNQRRAEAWGQGFLQRLEDSIKSGSQLTVGFGTFTTRERRDRYFNHLSGIAEVEGVYFMIPMKLSIQRIREVRPAGSKLVNAESVLHFYRTHNKTFAGEDHGDLDVPQDVPPEYRALLERAGYFQANQDRRWTVLTQPLEFDQIIDFFKIAPVNVRS